MATVYECDITGKQYDEEDKLREVGLFDHHGTWVEIEFGPEATIDEVRACLRDAVDSLQPFHEEWYDDRTDTYDPPRVVEKEVVGERFIITIPTVQQ